MKIKEKAKEKWERFSNLPKRYKQKIRDKAIDKAKVRITIAGRKPEQFTEEELEAIVREEEDKLISNLKEKGLVSLAAMFGLGWWL